MRSRSASGSVDSPSAVEPTRSRNRMVTTLRRSSTCAMRWSLGADRLELGELDARGERRRERRIKASGTDFTHGSGAGRNSGTDRVVRLALIDQRGEELSEEHVTRANPRDRLDE